MATEYVGIIVMEVDGQEVEIDSIDVTHKTGRTVVKTMNKDRRARGYREGVSEFELKVEAVIPKTGELDWASIKGAKITLYPADGGGQRESYLDCATLDIGTKYQLSGESMRSLTMGALRKVVE